MWITSSYLCPPFLSVLLVATGLWVPQKVEFVGSDLVEGYESISTNPEDYRDQAVLILGKGNSAFETAQSILGRASRVHMLSSSPVRLAWQTHYVGDLRYFMFCLYISGSQRVFQMLPPQPYQISVELFFKFGCCYLVNVRR